MPFVVEAISIEDVLAFDHIRYNTNNHWDSGLPPTDYQAVCEATNARNWIHLFKKYHVIDIDLKSPVASWLKGKV